MRFKLRDAGETMNTLYPIFLKLENQPVLIVGGGTVAEQKLNSLLGTGAGISVISPEVTESMATLLERHGFPLLRRKYQTGDAEGFSLVIGATNDRAAQEEIYRDARSKSIPVNIVDVPDLCTFYLSSVFHKGDLKIAVSTNGKSPTLGKFIRDKIRDEFAEGYSELLDTLGDIRPHVHASFPDYEKRKDVLKQIVRTELTRVRDRRILPEPSGTKAGRVFLIGAGPGDPELITVKGLRILSSADVLIHDSLVSDQLVERAPRKAEKIYVGKRAGLHCMNQRDINDLLIRKARQGGTVVRLKGGDPFVFGRGAEEVEALRKAGILVEIVPGITAGTGVPASIGIPLTNRKMSSSVVFATGHEDPEKGGERIDWKNLSSADTIVVYMGIRRIGSLVGQWLSNGLPPSKPVAVILAGTLPEEIIITGTLETIVGLVNEHNGDLPGLIVVGETVGFLEQKAESRSAAAMAEAG